MDIQPTAQVTLVTTKGNIEIELFAKELPLLCKEFLKNCVNKKYVGLEFAKVTSGLIQSLQLDTTCDIKKEKKSRVKFNSRGAVGLLRVEGTRFASASGFFISLVPTSEYGSEFVFIGNVVGESIYNVVKIKDSELKHGTESPLHPITVTDCLVSMPFFDDLLEHTIVTDNRKKKRLKTAVKLDYGEEDDEPTEEYASTFKVRSAHELLAGKKATTVDPRERRKDPPAKRSATDLEKAALEEQETEKRLDSPGLRTSKERVLSEKPNVEITADPVSSNTSTSPNREIVRDISVDSFDSMLDISEEEITFEMLLKHKFICH